MVFFPESSFVMIPHLEHKQLVHQLRPAADVPDGLTWENGENAGRTEADSA